MKKIIYSLSLLLFFSSCKQQQVDLIVTNATIYTVNDAFSKAEAFAIKDGKFVDVGSTSEITTKYISKEILDANRKTIVPGLIDAHCHFFRMGLQQQKVSLEGTKSYDEVLERLITFQKEKNVNFITGRGWDQNDWEVKEFPTKEKLDILFPNTPVAIRRIDGHALLANQAAIDITKVTKNTPVTGGEIIVKDGKMTGVFIDAAMDFIQVPKPTKLTSIQGLKDAQQIAFSYGLTTVDDAGLDQSTVELIDSLQQENELKIRIYAMISATQKNLDYYINKGIIKTDRLHVRSFKIYGDGALGSRGAAMRKSYSDRSNHFGALIYNPERYREMAKQIAASEYQMNTHAIGDSANTWILKTYKTFLQGKTNKRWRIEHAQIIAPEDFTLFENVIPSIQPTHATSDMYWAQDRIGKERMKGAYAYKDLLEAYGKVALGTDFPVEQVNPFLTFYAAAVRKDTDGYPDDGFQIENRLSREETLKGMTIWAAYSNFEENEKGSIEVGKLADFTILNQNIMIVDAAKIPKTKATATYVNGEKVY